MQIIKQKRVLKKEFLRALHSGDEVIDEARRMAGGIIEEAEKDAERIRSEAERVGLERGQAQAAGIILGAGRRKEKMLEQFEKEIIGLVLKAAAAIVDKSRQLDPLVVTEVYRRALSSFEGAAEITLRVCPEDHEAAGALLAEWEGGENISRRVRVVRDGAVSPGGCIVESELGSVDGRIETQLEAIRKALAGGDEFSG
jgi:type III secretion system HrpE/YscL family protein